MILHVVSVSARAVRMTGGFSPPSQGPGRRSRAPSRISGQGSPPPRVRNRTRASLGATPSGGNLATPPGTPCQSGPHAASQARHRTVEPGHARRLRPPLPACFQGRSRRGTRPARTPPSQRPRAGPLIPRPHKGFSPMPRISAPGRHPLPRPVLLLGPNTSTRRPPGGAPSAETAANPEQRVNPPPEPLDFIDPENVPRVGQPYQTFPRAATSSTRVTLSPS
ncbi:hypothetical protein LA6_000104 [Marinibacterium anthonyi]|nr:hypothetical protein LA6_000104 [Marinibacterium anthonyi]